MSRLHCLRCVRRFLPPAWRHIRNRPDAALDTLTGVFLAEHPTTHSALMDVCIDVGIVDVVEAVNLSICPTEWSCQGDAYPARPEQNAHAGRYPSISVADENWPDMRDWFERHEVPYTMHERDGDVLVPPTRSTHGVAVWSGGRNTHLWFIRADPHDVFSRIL